MKLAKIDARRFFSTTHPARETKFGRQSPWRYVKPHRFTELRGRLRLLGYISRGGRNVYFNHGRYQGKDAVFAFSPEDPSVIIVNLRLLETSLNFSNRYEHP